MKRLSGTRCQTVGDLNLMMYVGIVSIINKFTYTDELSFTINLDGGSTR